MGRTSPSVFQGFETPNTTNVYTCGFIGRCQDIKMQILLNTSSLDVLLQHHVSRSSIIAATYWIPEGIIVILQHPVVDVGRRIFKSIQLDDLLCHVMSHSSIYPTIGLPYSKEETNHTPFTPCVLHISSFTFQIDHDFCPVEHFKKKNISDFTFVKFLGPSLFLEKTQLPQQPICKQDALDLRYHPCCHHQIHCTGDAVSAPKEKIHVLSQKAESEWGSTPKIQTNERTNKRTNKETNKLNN